MLVGSELDTYLKCLQARKEREEGPERRWEALLKQKEEIETRRKAENEEKEAS